MIPRLSQYNSSASPSFPCDIRKSPIRFKDTVKSLLQPALLSSRATSSRMISNISRYNDSASSFLP